MKTLKINIDTVLNIFRIVVVAFILVALAMYSFEAFSDLDRLNRAF